MFETEKTNALAAIDAEAAAALCAARTHNQDLDIGFIHQMKVREAQAWQAARRRNEPEPPLAEFPLLSAEIGITAPTMHEIVGIIAAKHASFMHYVAEVEAMRLAAKKAIRASTTMDDVNSVLAALTWPDPAIVV